MLSRFTQQRRALVAVLPCHRPQPPPTACTISTVSPSDSVTVGVPLPAHNLAVVRHRDPAQGYPKRLQVDGQGSLLGQLLLLAVYRQPDQAVTSESLPERSHARNMRRLSSRAAASGLSLSLTALMTATPAAPDLITKSTLPPSMPPIPITGTSTASARPLISAQALGGGPWM